MANKDPEIDVLSLTLHAITMLVTFGTLYGAWVVSGLVITAGGLGRVFAWLGVFMVFSAAMSVIVFLAITLPREVRRARFWKSRKA